MAEVVVFFSHPAVEPPGPAFVVIQLLDLLGDRDAGPAVGAGRSLDIVAPVVPFLPAVLAPQVHRTAYYYS